jgi:hypothetical protein
MTDKNEDNNLKRNLAKFSSLAFQMAFIIGGGTLLGDYLDQKQQNEFPIWTLILSLTSVGLALYYVLKEIIKRD